MAEIEAPPVVQKNPFVRRILAFAIDSILLGFVGHVIATLFRAPLIEIGQYGPLIGLVITVLYFGILNSQPLKGHTLGKRFLKLRVTRVAGGYLPLHLSLCRSFIYALPFVANNWQLDLGRGVPAMIVYATLSGSIFAYFVSLLLFTIGNWRSGRLLHDVLFGTKVSIDHPDTITKPKREKAFALITLLVFIAVAGPTILGFNKHDTQISISELSAMQSSLMEAQPGWKFGVNLSTFQGKNPVAILKVSIIPNRLLTDSEKMDARLKTARLTLTTYSGIGNVDYMSIAVIEGFNIGIASRYKAPGERWSIGAWREKLSVDGDTTQGKGKEVPFIPSLWKH